jgi:hypothetical protein
MPHDHTFIPSYISHIACCFSDLLQISADRLCELGSGNRVVVQASQNNAADSGQESIDPYTNPHGLGVVGVQLVMLPCAKHGCDMVEDGDGDEGFRVGSVDAAAGVGTGEDEQGRSERDEAPAVGAYVVELEIYVFLALDSLGAAVNAIGLPVGFRCDSTGGRNPRDASENQLRLKPNFSKYVQPMTIRGSQTRQSPLEPYQRALPQQYP